MSLFHRPGAGTSRTPTVRAAAWVIVGLLVLALVVPLVLDGVA